MHSAFSWDPEVPSQIMCSTDLPQLHNLWHSVPPAAKCPMQLNNSVLHCVPHALQVRILSGAARTFTPHTSMSFCVQAGLLLQKVTLPSSQWRALANLTPRGASLTL